MNEIDFDAAFKALTGNAPFPWQRELYETWFSRGEFPDACTLPTGLGKTSVIAVWLLALAANPAAVPRRLVYVVNRRTVVDQSTREAEKLRQNLTAAGLVERLRPLCTAAADVPLAISTLRGQFADNQEWSADPSRPAVIVGTVDMIGSRLLFSGYGRGFKSRPLHAGFLGQDTLLVHDEAHLEPAFQELIVNIQREQHERERTVKLPWPRLRVMELTATSRGRGAVHTLSDEDRDKPEVRKRIGAKKAIHLHPVEKKLTDDIVKYAEGEHTTDRAVLIFVRQVKDVEEIVKKLPKGRVQQLTGTLRGLERDRMADPRREDGCPIFARYLRPPKADADERERWKVEPRPGTVYLVCTSAGEVGVNISADHMVCDLSTFDSMAQRFGRVNRFGEQNDSRIDVVYPSKFEDNDLGVRLELTLGLLQLLNGDGSPTALADLRDRAAKEGSGTGPMSADHTAGLRKYVLANPDQDPRLAAYAPPPTTLPTSDILFDAWALTTVRDLPGRPRVEEYLHGVEDERQRETQVAWREEVALFDETDVTDRQLGELLGELSPRPHELLRDATWRVQDELADLAKGREKTPVWVIDPDDTVRVLTLGRLAEKDNKRYVENLSGRTVVLPPSAGGLTGSGTLSGKEPYNPAREYDVGGRVTLASGQPLVRLVVFPTEGVLTYKPVSPALDLPAEFQFEVKPGDKSRQERERLRERFLAEGFPPMRVAYRLDLRSDEEAGEKAVEYLVLEPERPRKPDRTIDAAWPTLDDHREGVRGFAVEMCSRLGLPREIARAVELAAWWHDLGKGRRVWQAGAGNRPGLKPVSKPLHGRAPENLNHFRHELGSVVDVCGDPALAAEVDSQEGWARELTLHLIAAHHGRARPHFPDAEANDPERPAVGSASVAADTPGRFARLQRRFGRWGLAYLESLVRAADALDSKRIEETPIGVEEQGKWTPIPAGFKSPQRRATPEPTIRVAVDPTNPGQFFACCGLLELADRLWPPTDERDGAEGWFGKREFCIACGGTLPALLSALVGATAEQVTRLPNDLEVKPLLAPLRLTFQADPPLVLSLDAWMTIRAEKGEVVAAANPPWNFWAGHQTPVRIWNPVRAALARLLTTLDAERAHRLFEQREFLTGRFGFDPGPAWNALDVGFSPNEQGIRVESSPAVELLAAVGVQRFRPRMGESRDWFVYSTWGIPLGPTVAAAAAAGAISCGPAACYRGRVVSRGQYAALAYSTPLPGGSDE